MTYPQTDWVGLYGAGSPQYNAQLNAFNSVRDRLLQNYMAQMAAVGAQPGIQPQMYAGQTIPEQQAPPPATLEWHDEDLVGAAMYWGIPQEAARAMPKEALVEYVNSKRLETRPDMETLEGRLAAIPGVLLSLPAQAGLAIGQAVTGGLQRLPIIGEAFSRIEGLRDADMWLRQLEEGVRASTPANTQMLQTGAEAAGWMAAMWHPGVLTWNGAGRIAQALPIVKRFSPISRAALQGGASVYALEGGSPEFEDHPYLMLGAGVVLGAVGARLEKPIAALATRMQQKFVSPEIVAAAAGDTPRSTPVSVNPADEQAARIARLEAMAAAGDQQAAEILSYMRQPQQVHHFGTYAGGPSTPDASITAEAGTLGRGLYVAATPNPNVVPEIQFAEAAGRTPQGQWQSFGLSRDAKIFDLDAPIDDAVFGRIIENIDPGVRIELLDARQAGRLKTNSDLYYFGMADELDAMPGQADAFNAQLAEQGFVGVKFGQEINVFAPNADQYLTRTGAGMGAQQSSAAIPPDSPLLGPVTASDEGFRIAWEYAKARAKQAGVDADDPGRIMEFFDPSEAETLAGKVKEGGVFFDREGWKVYAHNDEIFFAELPDNAANLAAQMNKVSTIMDSPAMPSIAGQADIDVVSVARAADASNPGGTNLIQGIADPQQILANMGGRYVAFAQRGKRMDVLISDLPILPGQVNDYEKFGVYKGMQVLLPDGVEGTVQAVSKAGSVTVKPMYSGATKKLNYKRLSPQVLSPGTMDAEPLWRAFKQYATDRAAISADAMPGGVTIEKVATILSENRMQYVDDFLTDVAKFSNSSDRARAEFYFRERYVDDFKFSAPEEAMLQEAATGQAAAVIERVELPAVQQLDELAMTKGFTAIPNGRGGWELADNIGNPGSRTRITFGSLEAAESWLKNMNRELPDITPNSDVPIELQASHPRVAQQGPNTNESTPRLMRESLRELTEPEPMTGGPLTGATPESVTLSGEPGIVAGRGGSAAGTGTPAGPGNVPPAGLDVDPDNVGRLRNLWADGFSRWQPMRRFFSNIDNTLHQAGMPTGIARDYDDVASSLVRHHNEMHPWFDELTDVMKKVGTTKWLSDGTWARLYEMDNVVERAAAARAAGFSEREIATFDEFEGIMQRLFPETGLDEIRQIPRYFSHIAQRQSDPALVSRAFDDFQLGPTTRPFYEYARTGNLNLREMDPRIVGEAYIRALFWQKNMAEPFNRVVNKWRALSETEELAPAATLMENWLKVIRYGYNADDDLALDVLHGTLRAVVGPEISRAQTKELFNFGLNMTHAGLLGFRLHVMARDSLQLAFALPRAGPDLANVIRKYVTDTGFRARMWEEAIDTGAVALQTPRMSAPGALQGELESVAGVAVAPGQAGWRLRLAGQVQNAVRDLLPETLKGSVRDTKLHPMYFYAKQGELMRALVYTAGREKTARALAKFRAGGSLDELMGESGARTFDPSWQRQFQEIVASGDDQAAERFLGRQLADATQFKYGQPESPWAAKSITGRMAMQFGNYSMQYYQFMRESLTNGTVADKAKLLMTMGAVTAGLEGATRETGWNFRWMNPFFGLGFTGGPWLSLTTDIAEGVSSFAREAQQGQEPPSSVYRDFNQAFGQAASFLNPVAGLYRTAQGLGQAMDSPLPMHAIGRLLVTGERGPGPDINRAFLPQAEEAFQRSLQPMQNPVSFTRPGTVEIPQQPTTFPTPDGWMPNGQGYLRPPDQVPAPGGQPYAYRPNPATTVPDELLTLAIAGQPEALALFDREDQEILAQLAGVPPEIRKTIWDSYQAAKVGNTAGRAPIAPQGRGNTSGGGGAQY